MNDVCAGARVAVIVSSETNEKKKRIPINSRYINTLQCQIFAFRFTNVTLPYNFFLKILFFIETFMNPVKNILVLELIRCKLFLEFCPPRTHQNNGIYFKDCQMILLFLFLEISFAQIQEVKF